MYELSRRCMNTAEATKNICCAKCDGTVDHNTVTKWFKKFCSDFKNLDDQTRSGRCQNKNSKAVLQAIEENLTISTQYQVSSASQHPSMFCHLHNHGKCIQHCQIMPHITKILQTFDSLLY